LGAALVSGPTVDVGAGGKAGDDVRRTPEDVVVPLRGKALDAVEPGGEIGAAVAVALLETGV